MEVAWTGEESEPEPSKEKVHRGKGGKCKKSGKAVLIGNGVQAVMENWLHTGY